MPPQTQVNAKSERAGTARRAGQYMMSREIRRNDSTLDSAGACGWRYSDIAFNTAFSNQYFSIACTKTLRPITQKSIQTDIDLSRDTGAAK